MNELEITLDVLQRLYRDYENGNRTDVKHILALADKCERLNAVPIPEVTAIKAALSQQTVPTPEAPAPPVKKAKRKPL